MALPLVLAGPILRRVDPGLVAVWMAFSNPVELTLRVWEDRVSFDTTAAPYASSEDPPDPSAPSPFPGPKAVRIGENLYVGMVTARIPPVSGKSFRPDQLYSYDVRLTALAADGSGPAPGTPVQGLGELGMLGERVVSGVTLPPLGYSDRMLPSFALPPSELDHLRIAYGSCRRPLYDDGDALAWIDDLLKTSVGDPRGRVHQLFLGGDQIYADDVSRVMMPRVIDLGVELIGQDDQTAIERIKVDKIVRLRVPGEAADGRHPASSYRDETADEAKDGDLAAGAECFPPGHRLSLTTRSAKFTSEDGSNHLISFGEFAALYLLVWSPECWGLEATGIERQTGEDPATAQPLKWLDELGEADRVIYGTRQSSPGIPEPNCRDFRADPTLPEPGLEDPRLQMPVYPDRVPLYLFEPPPEEKPDPAPQSPEQEAKAKAKRQEAKENEVRGRRNAQRVHRDFLLGLGKVQRVLANVPTYMILDDHDLTDDLFLNPLWRHRVMSSKLGQTIMTNGMLAYALFQDWGNDPRRYDLVTAPDVSAGAAHLPGDLLVLAQRYFAKGKKQGPDPEVFTGLNRMFGHDLDNEPNDSLGHGLDPFLVPDGYFRPVRPPLTWHFSVDGPRHTVVALDNRTRRSYASEIGPPGNVSPEALADQLPVPPLDAGREVLIVIAPLQVLGPGVIDDIVSPAIYRIFDTAHARKLAHDEDSGSRLMPGTNPDALETWALEPLAFEHLLKRLAEHQRVVLLSGDVHNSTGNVMSYWRAGVQRPARIAQFTSSGFKNVMPTYLQALDRSAMLLQQMLRVGIGVERFGWDRPAENLILLPQGRSENDLVASTRAKLKRSPVLLPAHGWIDDNAPREAIPEKTSRLNPAHPPDWCWQTQPLLDTRSDLNQLGDETFDDHRPPPIQVRPLPDGIEAQLADPAQMFAAFKPLAARHQAALDRMRNARQMLFRSNFGICRFETATDTAITAVHEVYTQAIDPETNLPVMNKYMVQKAPLGLPRDADPSPDDIPAPTKLRVAVIEPRPVPAPDPEPAHP